VTPFISLDHENVLAVRLENPPNSSRWYPGGGIYRNVWLVKTEPVSVAQNGVFVSVAQCSSEQAMLRVSAEIENRTGSASHVDVRIEISEPGKGVVAVSPNTDVLVPAHRSEKYETEIVIDAPRRWSTESPALYQAKTIVRADGQVVDESGTVFGIRTAQFNPDSGFVLNGRRVRLNGVCNHHDLGVLGTAVSKAAIERQIRLLKEIGCNAIRTSHNPPAPELLDLCDRMGMLVLDEVFDCWAEGKTANDYSTLFNEWHEKDIRAFVRRDRNHPCVVAWSSGNEVREQKDGILSRKLREIFRSEDPTRPVTAGCDQPDAGFNGFQNSVDVFGYNYKPRLYAKFLESNPQKPLYGSETASCISTNGEYFFPVAENKSKGFANGQVSSYDLYAPYWANIPDVEFEGQDKNPSVAGEFVWTGFDYLGEPTPYADDTCRSRSSYFGIYDLCGFKKDRCYLYQSRWRPELPVAHILPHWNWPGRVGETTPVHVYTSGDEAELFLNGRSLGRKTKQPFQYRLRWDEVRYEPGEVRVIAYKGGKEWASDLVKTTGTAAKVELSADREQIFADGHDLVFITVKIADSEGLMVPTAENLVRFSVHGPGVIAAVGNGDPTDHGSFQSDQTKAFHGQCLLVVRSIKGKEGQVRLSAAADGLEGATILVSTKP